MFSAPALLAQPTPETGPLDESGAAAGARRNTAAVFAQQPQPTVGGAGGGLTG